MSADKKEIGRITWEQMSPTNKAAYIKARGGVPADYTGRRFRIMREPFAAFSATFEIIQEVSK